MNLVDRYYYFSCRLQLPVLGPYIKIIMVREDTYCMEVNLLSQFCNLAYYIICFICY